MKLAIVVSSFNPKVTEGLFRGAKDFLDSQKVSYDRFTAPGAFEIPLIAKRLAFSKLYDGIICLGCVIKGDTAHFEFISLGTTIGLQQVALETGRPVTFGILTTYNDEQAQVRSSEDSHNKGIEAASACYQSVKLLMNLTPDPSLNLTPNFSSDLTSN